jgi:chromosome segregation protein
VERTREENTEGKILVASLKEKLESINNNLIQLKEFEEDLLRQILKKEKGLKETEQEIEYLQSLDAESRIEINRLIEVHREFETSLFREKEEYQKEVEKLREKEEFLKKLRKELGETNQKINHLNLELDKLILHMKHVEDRIEEKYQVRLEKILFGVKVSDFGTKESEKRISWLNKMIKSLGEINLMAIKEHEELTKRYDFLTEQQTDLVQSLDSLQKAITKINRITKKRFKEVFGAINSKFQEVFSLLFEGGQAELFLTDESDLLETGIDVTIRPPGKRLQNINLLSKGEKVLAAIALMFSLFLIKPTPFSLLDEVDAALDDANNDRFIKMVKRLSADSQFIIISHNKKAMEISDTLLGVTMENAGVSKLISVKMN